MRWRLLAHRVPPGDSCQVGAAFPATMVTDSHRRVPTVPVYSWETGPRNSTAKTTVQILFVWGT